MKAKSKYILFSIFILLAFYFLLFWNLKPENHLIFPSWINQNNCKNPKILALSDRNVTYKSAPILLLGLDFLLSQVSNNSYFRTDSFLSIIDINKKEIAYEIPNVNIDSILLSTDGKWLLYTSKDILFINSIDKRIEKKIEKVNPQRLLDWSEDLKKILFIEDNRLFFGYLENCLKSNNEKCVISKRLVNYPIENWVYVNYARIIDENHILIKKWKNNTILTSITGENLVEISDSTCDRVDFNSSKNEYLFSCNSKLLKYSSTLEYISSIYHSGEISEAIWQQDGKRIFFNSMDDTRSFRLFDNTSEKSLYPSRLYSMDDNNLESIQPIYLRNDERIMWFDLIGKLENCSKSPD